MWKRIRTFLASIWHRRTLKVATQLTGKKITLDKLTPNLKAAVRVHKNHPHMVERYRKQMGYTGGMISRSMAIAYDKGVKDTLKLFLPKEQ